MTRCIGAIPVPAPFPDIAVHLPQPPGITWQLIHRYRFLSIQTICFIRIVRFSIVVDLLRRNLIAKMERRRRPSPTGIFPFGLRG